MDEHENRIREVRIERGWSQRELARRLDISQEYLSRVERGAKGMGWRKRRDAALVLGQPEEDLFPSETPGVDGRGRWLEQQRARADVGEEPYEAEGSVDTTGPKGGHSLTSVAIFPPGPGNALTVTLVDPSSGSSIRRAWPFFIKAEGDAQARGLARVLREAADEIEERFGQADEK